jgi:transcriptional regulator with XRE-family HTH domain
MTVIEPAPFQEVGSVIAEFRLSRNMSQVNLAVNADFDHSYISRLESGSRNPTRDALERISRALRLNHSEEAVLMNAGGFIATHRSQEHREWSELFSLVHDPGIRPDIRTAAQMFLGGLLNMLRTEKEVLVSRTGGGTLVRSESVDGKHVVTVEQPL